MAIGEKGKIGTKIAGNCTMREVQTGSVVLAILLPFSLLVLLTVCNVCLYIF